MLDDLRRSASGEFDDNEPEEIGIIDEIAPEERLILGMTPVERMFISIFLFMNVAVLGIALLLATNRLVF
jgi:hypothetical protein